MNTVHTAISLPEFGSIPEKYLEEMVTQLPRFYIRGPDILAVQSPLEIEKRGITVGVLRPSSLD